jgi:excisionase family DNA binding protein
MGIAVRDKRAVQEVLEAKVSPQQRDRAHRAAQVFRAACHRDDLVVTGPSHDRVPVPRELAVVVGRVIDAIADGHLVGILARPDDVISTAEAGQMLGVSRYHVTKLIDAGLLRARATTGVHRRLLMEDVVAYRERSQRRHAALDAMTEEAETLGLYREPTAPAPKRAKPVSGRPTRAARTPTRSRGKR